MKHCAIMGVPHLSQRMYQKHKTVICETVSAKMKSYQNRSVGNQKMQTNSTKQDTKKGSDYSAGGF